MILKAVFIPNQELKSPMQTVVCDSDRLEWPLAFDLVRTRIEKTRQLHLVVPLQGSTLVLRLSGFRRIRAQAWLLCEEEVVQKDISIFEDQGRDAVLDSKAFVQHAHAIPTEQGFVAFDCDCYVSFPLSGLRIRIPFPYVLINALSPQRMQISFESKQYGDALFLDVLLPRKQRKNTRRLAENQGYEHKGYRNVRVRSDSVMINHPLQRFLLLSEPFGQELPKSQN